MPTSDDVDSFESSDDLEAYVCRLAGLDDHKKIDEICTTNESLANGSTTTLYEWAWALFAIGDDSRAFQIFTRRAKLFGCSDPEALDFLTAANYPQPANYIIALGTVLLSAQATEIRARIVTQALLENLFFKVDEDVALGYLVGVLDNYQGSPVALAEVGKRLRTRGDPERPKRYFRSALRLIQDASIKHTQQSETGCDETRAALNRIESAQLETAEPFDVLAVEAAKLGEINCAVALLKKCSESDQRDKAAYQGGVICEQSGDFNSAITLYDLGGWGDAAFRAHIRFDGYLDIAEYLDQHERINEAVEVLDEESAWDIRALKRAVVLLAETGRPSDALERAEDAVATNPDDLSLRKLLDYVKAKIDVASSLPAQKSFRPL